MKALTPFILIIAAGGLIWSYVMPVWNGDSASVKTFLNPTGKSIIGMKAKLAAYDEALQNVSEIKAKLAKLQTANNSISDADHARLSKLVPEKIDIVRLIIDVNVIAARHGILLKEIPKIEEKGDEGGTNGYVDLAFVVGAPYQAFRSFLTDLENSLRLTDVTSISFTAGPKDFYDFSISLRTYWVKNELPVIKADNV